MPQPKVVIKHLNNCSNKILSYKKLNKISIYKYVLNLAWGASADSFNMLIIVVETIVQ